MCPKDGSLILCPLYIEDVYFAHTDNLRFVTDELKFLRSDKDLYGAKES